jgi:hypothetical protein
MVMLNGGPTPIILSKPGTRLTKKRIPRQPNKAGRRSLQNSLLPAILLDGRRQGNECPRLDNMSLTPICLDTNA